MIPSANSTGDLTWHAATPDNWADHQAAAAAAAGGAYSSSSSTAAGADSRYLNLHRHQILDWENAMLLAHHSNNHDSVYDQVADYNKPHGINMQADAIASLSHPRNYENLLSAHMASNSSNFSSHNAWGLLNTVCSRSSGGLQQESSLLQQAPSVPYSSYESFSGADGLEGYGSLAAAGGLFSDPLRSGSSSSHAGILGLTSFDQRRLDDIVKRELYTTHDFNSRLGLNLGGRTYFSADDFAFGRWGKRLRPNSPGCIMQPAPLCQAEGCKADLSLAKHYHRRHKVCEYHSKAATVHIGDQTQRFCQQCSRFHVLSEFDDGKRSCRKRLADHNRRRRKPQPAPTLAIDAAPESKEQSQEAATGSESLQNGTQSSKGSPQQTAEDQAAVTTSTSTPGISSMGNSNEASSKKARVVQEKVQKSEPTTASPTSATKIHLTSNDSSSVANHIAIATTGTSQMAASLSLGATDILDVKPAPSITHAGFESSHDGGHFGMSLGANKHGVVMPWLQGPKKPQNLQKFPYNNSTKTDHNVNDQGMDNPPYEKVATGIQGSKSISSTDQDNSDQSSWMIKGMTSRGAKSEKDAMLVGSQYAGASKSANEAGGHDLLRLLGDERELISSSKNTAMQADPSSTGTLSFLDHSLDPSTTFTRVDHHHRMLHFSGLQQSDAHHQVASSLNRPSSNLAFGNHNHMI